MKLVLNPEYGLYKKRGQAFCDSLQVAEAFEKEHYNVIRDIEALDCSQKFTDLNFEGSSYKDSSGERNKMYLLTKDGFTFLVFVYFFVPCLPLLNRAIFHYH